MELVQLIEWHFISRTAFLGSSPTRSPEKELKIRGPWKRGLKKWPYFNVGFQLACTRLSVSANKRKMRASSHSKRAKNSRRKKGRACNHTSIHPYLVCNTVVLGSSRNSLKNGCVTDYPLPWPLPEKPFSCQNVKCQNVQRCGVGGFHQLNLFVRHCEREAKWLT